MPNGKDVLNDLEFEQKIERMKDRQLLEFMARQVFDQRTDITAIAGDVKGNKRRSIINRFAILALIAILIALGILKPEILALF